VNQPLRLSDLGEEAGLTLPSLGVFPRIEWFVMEPDRRRRTLFWTMGLILIVIFVIALTWPFIECPLLANDLRSFDLYAKGTTDPLTLQQKYRDRLHDGCLRCGGAERVSLVRRLLPGTYYTGP
jgi:hypothetical protein